MQASMKFLKYFTRCVFLAFGILGVIYALIALSSLPGDRARLAALRRADGLVKQYRATEGRLPDSVRLLVEGKRGRPEEVKISVYGWHPVRWSRVRAGMSFEKLSDNFATDYLLAYSLPTCDWTDVLDSKTGKTSLDFDQSQSEALFSAGQSLLFATACFYAARRLQRA